MIGITPQQCKAARALLGWSQKELASRCAMSLQTISNFESDNVRSSLTKASFERIEMILQNAGIKFLDYDGVKKISKGVKILNGREGFHEFIDDLYETAKESGGEICVFNVDERNWMKWLGQEKWDSHNARMAEIKHTMNDKIVIQEDDWFFLASDFAEYKWFPKKLFNDKCFYAYGNKLALFSFTENDVRIMVLQEPEFAETFRTLFNAAWDNIAFYPPTENPGNIK